MTKTKRANGKLIRKIAKLDRKWRLEGKTEGCIANRLVMELGIAGRRGMGAKSREVQSQSAARLGQLSGWENV